MLIDSKETATHTTASAAALPRPQAPRLGDAPLHVQSGHTVATEVPRHQERSHRSAGRPAAHPHAGSPAIPPANFR